MISVVCCVSFCTRAAMYIYSSTRPDQAEGKRSIELTFSFDVSCGVILAFYFGTELLPILAMLILLNRVPNVSS
jgi:hypothetical protein